MGGARKRVQRGAICRARILFADNFAAAIRAGVALRALDGVGGEVAPRVLCGAAGWADIKKRPPRETRGRSGCFTLIIMQHDAHLCQ